MAETIPSGPTSEVLQWATNFRNTLTANLTTYGVTAGESAQMAILIANFTNAFNVAGVIGRTAVNPAGYTQPNRDLLVVARNACIAYMRPIAQRIRVNPGLTDAAKLAAGVAPVNLNRTPLVMPNNFPSLQISENNVLNHVVTYSVSDNPTQTSKIDAATSVLLFGKPSATPITDPAELSFLGSYTTNRMQTPQYNPADAGKRVYMAARWAGANSQLGPWSDIISGTIVGA